MKTNQNLYDRVNTILAFLEISDISNRMQNTYLGPCYGLIYIHTRETSQFASKGIARRLSEGRNRIKAADSDEFNIALKEIASAL